MTRSDHYDFSEARDYLNEWFAPEELAEELRRGALGLAALGTGDDDRLVRAMQLAVLDACDFLDAIRRRGPSEQP